MGRIQFTHSYEDIISLGNLLEAWREFVKGKRKKLDVQEFSLHLMDNILHLHHDLKAKTYAHGKYEAFSINDPKPRSIHKATVRDRLLHRALYRKLYPFFDRVFIADSYSCRIGKGTHRAFNRFRRFAWRCSEGNSNPVWVLKCDIRKFFANIDHDILMTILRCYIPDRDILSLLRAVISSFYSHTPGIGLPLGNLTSQLLVNIYMNEFDQYVKHTLKVKHYIRYADDFVFLHHEKAALLGMLPKVQQFLSENLKLTLHPDKVFIKTFASGPDFLGWVHFPDHRVLRTATRRRMMRRIKGNPSLATVASYLGMLAHGNAWKLRSQVIQMSL